MSEIKFIVTKAKGFTLIELSIVILIVGILIIPLLQLYNTYLIQQRQQTTQENIDVVTSAIGIFSPVRLPCPSDRSLGLNSPNYGIEQCNLATIPNCLPALNQGICKTNGTRDADGDGTLDLIVIGGVPFKDTTGTNIKQVYGYNILDGWNRKLTYAVSAKLMNPANTDGKQNYKWGVINALDENGNQTAGVVAPGDAQYVVLSHGENGAGAFEYGGIMHAPCPAATVVEANNCNNDAVFVQGIGAYNAAGNTYYDDMVHFGLLASGDLWYIVPDAANKPSDHINNLNTGRVGVKTTTPDPSVKLDVAGNISADTIRAERLCDKSGNNCFAPTFFGGSKLCPTGQVMVGYSNSSPVCSLPSLNITNPTWPAVNCQTDPLGGPSYWLKGILTNGCVICSNGITDVRLPNVAACF